MSSKTLKASKTLDMTQGPIISQVIAFTIPLLIGNLLQQLYNMVDSIVVGQFCSYTALAAVGTAGSPMQVMIALFLGIGTGATILVSQHKGAGDADSIRTVVRTGNTFIMAVFLPLTIVGMIASPFILRFMNVPDTVFSQANTYLIITFLGTLPNLGYNMNAGILRGLGDSRAPLKFLALSTAVNIVLDLVFVAVFHWDVAGVAIATIIAQFAAWIYSIWHIKRHYPELDFKVFRASWDAPTFKEMVRLGLPLGFNNAIFSLGFILLNSLVNQQGDIFMAGANAASRVDNLIFLPITSFAAAATTFAGQNVGAMQHERLKQGFWRIMGIAQLTNAVLSGIILLLGKYVLAIFTTEQAVIEVGLSCIGWIAPWYWLYNIFAICNNYMNGAGEVRIPTLSSLFMFWGVRLPTAYLMYDLFGTYHIFACYPASWAAGAILSGLYFASGRWKRHYLSRAGNMASEKGSLPPELPALGETEVYFVRHAEADRTQGDDMSHPLTEKGLADSRKVTEYLDRVGVDRMFSSPMKRAVMTMMDAAIKWGHNIEIIDDFRERKVGDAWVEDFRAFTEAQWNDLDYALPGGESLRGVQQRTVSALADVLLRSDGQKAAIGCHGAMLCVLIHYYRPEFGHEDYLQMQNKLPWIVRMSFKGGELAHMEFVDLY